MHLNWKVRVLGQLAVVGGILLKPRSTSMFSLSEMDTVQKNQEPWMTKEDTL